jgi:hypothetical protein
LWQVSYSLNNLIARLQSSRQAETNFQQLQARLQSVYRDIDTLKEIVRQTKQQGRSPALGDVSLKSDSALAPLYQEIFNTPPPQANGFSSQRAPSSKPYQQ